MDAARIEFLFGSPGVDPDDPRVRRRLLASSHDGDSGELSKLRDSLREAAASQIVDDDPPEV